MDDEPIDSFTAAARPTNSASFFSRYLTLEGHFVWTSIGPDTVEVVSNGAFVVSKGAFVVLKAAFLVSKGALHDNNYASAQSIMSCAACL